MSSLLHQFIVKTIREERELSPKSFDIPVQTAKPRTGGPKIINTIAEPPLNNVREVTDHALTYRPVEEQTKPDKKKRKAS